MGVPGFYGRWLTSHAAAALSKLLPALVSSLYFDLNGMYHAAYKLASTVPKDVFQDQQQTIVTTHDPQRLLIEVKYQLNKLLVNAINGVRPVDAVVFAVDGPAPAGKLKQQRGRRFRSAYAPSDEKKYDSNAITPGTEIMFDLEQFMRDFISTYHNYLPPQVIFSGHLVPGEGEHKIMDYLREGRTTKGLASQQGGAHVIWGLDADLIMLSLVSPVSKIFLARENSSELVDIDVLKAELANKIPNSASRPTLINDFIVIMKLIGDDFLPHPPSLQHTADDLEMLWKVYGEGNYQLTDPAQPGEVHWPGFLNYLVAIANTEPTNLARLSQAPVKFPSRYLHAAITAEGFDYNIFRNAWYNRVLGVQGNPETTAVITQILDRYRPTSHDLADGSATISIAYGSVTAKDVTAICMDYLRTIAWGYRYYVLGTSQVNTDWVYSYYHTPLFTDIALVLSELPAITGYHAYPGMRIFNALEQMVAVLPSSSAELLPEELRPLMTFNSPIRDLFPIGFQLEMDGRNSNHEGVPIVPAADRSRIINAVASIPFDPKRLLRWKPGTDLVLLRDVEQQIQLNTIREMRERKPRWEGRDPSEDPRRDGGRTRDRTGGQQGQSRGSYRDGKRDGRTGGPPSQNAGPASVASSSASSVAVPPAQQPVMAFPPSNRSAFTPAQYQPPATATVAVAQQPVMAMPGRATSTVAVSQQPVMAFPNAASSQQAPPVPISMTTMGLEAPSAGPVKIAPVTPVVASQQQPIMALPGARPSGSTTTTTTAPSTAKPVKYPAFMMKPLM